jgi:hypothetical protein
MGVIHLALLNQLSGETARLTDSHLAIPTTDKLKSRKKVARSVDSTARRSGYIVAALYAKGRNVLASALTAHYLTGQDMVHDQFGANWLFVYG